MDRQTMYCHACHQDFTLEIDMGLNGNHVFECPHCSHEHCRVVKDGVVTSDRWDQRNGNLGLVYTASTTTTVSNLTISGTSASSNNNSTAYTTCSFMLDAWNNATTSDGYFHGNTTVS